MIYFHFLMFSLYIFSGLVLQVVTNVFYITRTQISSKIQIISLLVCYFFDSLASITQAFIFGKIGEAKIEIKKRFYSKVSTDSSESKTRMLSEAGLSVANKDVNEISLISRSGRNNAPMMVHDSVLNQDMRLTMLTTETVETHEKIITKLTPS